MNCKLIGKESFPDLLIVKSINSESSIRNEKDMMEIDVAQTREVNNFLSYKSYYGNYKTVIIDNAERMNQEAQSCFLKTLEEPKGKTIIILATSRPEVLLPTIFSRCQAMKFFPVGKYKESKEEQNILQELLSIMHSELAVKFNYAKKINLEGDNFNIILRGLQRHFRNLMLMKIGVIKEINPPKPVRPGANGTKGRENYPQNGNSRPGASNYSVQTLKKIMRLIEALHKQMAETNASPKLALEILLMEI